MLNRSFFVILLDSGKQVFYHQRMVDGIDTSPTTRFEASPSAYAPESDPLMHRVIVKTDIASGAGIEQTGYATDILGAKIDLQQVANHNKQRQESAGRTSSGIYERLYFTTETGTIYCARNLPDDTWEVTASNNPTTHRVQATTTVEVGQRFTSPHHIDGKPELSTSPVKNITLVDRHSKGSQFGIRFSNEETDIGTQYVKAVQARGGIVR